jgi:hypothetical protein
MACPLTLEGRAGNNVVMQTPSPDAAETAALPPPSDAPAAATSADVLAAPSTAAMAPAAETAPAEISPAETVQAETAPAEISPAETAPAQIAPAETASAETVTLEPRYWVPLGVSLLGPLLLPLLPLWSPARWLALLLVAFGGFLLLQSAWLRLVFEPEALVVRRQDQEIRRFPYSDWSAWRLFWPSLPILFYFREVRSIHFLPMLFDATALRQQLEQRVPRG